ncbi:Protein of unknown function (DUF3558) [Goodfellowiella coeruleoviolacea]|uniref:DUF3558 domain-containing protein n=1 Tax=Goodfellowiella coeruleoviolacea TaxID=334858 RepID=A0AAE3GKU2_9PSEU|nr:Protein of unknown function (DUF3558) [Goodfellowiella coeruleoviolacea]
MISPTTARRAVARATAGVLVGLVLVGLVLVGCASGVTGGTPVASPGASSGANSVRGSRGADAENLPARPEELRVDGVDPCRLLTAEQQRELGADVAPSLDVDNADDFGNHACAYSKYRGEPRYGWSIVAVAQEGATVWLREKRASDARVVRVGDFGAVEIRVGADTACSVVVDVAEGQNLDVQFTLITAGALTQDEMCAKAGQGAELAVRTLRTMR